MACKPANNITMVKPVHFHISTKAQDNIAILGSVSQFCANISIPINLKNLLISPLEGCIIALNTSPTATLFKIAGRKNTVRMYLAPLNFLFTKTAKASPRPTFPTVVTKAKTSVFLIAMLRYRSVSTFI